MSSFTARNVARFATALFLSAVAGVDPTVAAQSSTPDCTAPPYNVPAGYPSSATTAAQDQAHMMCLQNLQFPGPNSAPAVPPTRSGDPNKPPNAWPGNLTTPETSNWTDALGHTIVRWGWGQWTTYDDSDSGGAANVFCGGGTAPAAGCTVAGQIGTATGGAAAGFFGDMGPFSTPQFATRPYPTGSAPLGDGNNQICTAPGCLAATHYTPINMFTMTDGATRIATPTDWWVKRRPELLDLVQKELYGYMWPAGQWPTITWTVSAVTTGTQAGTVGCTTNGSVCPNGTVADGNTYPYRQKTYTGTFSMASYPATAPPLRKSAGNHHELSLSCQRAGQGSDDHRYRWCQYLISVHRSTRLRSLRVYPDPTAGRCRRRGHVELSYRPGQRWELAPAHRPGHAGGLGVGHQPHHRRVCAGS